MLLVCVEAGRGAGWKWDFEGVQNETDMAVVADCVGEVDGAIDTYRCDNSVVDGLINMTFGNQGEGVEIE